MPNRDKHGLIERKTTGRYLVVMDETAVAEGLRDLESKAGIRTTDFRSLTGPTPPVGLTSIEGNITFEQIGVAVVTAEPEQLTQMRGLAAASSSSVRIVEEERYVFALTQAQPVAFDAPAGNGHAVLPSASPYNDVALPEPDPLLARRDAQSVSDYVRGYRAAVNALADGVLAHGQKDPGTLLAREVEAQVAGTTWGLAATRVPSSRYTGRGIRIAVLDTGIDLFHPDFAGRVIQHQSFVDGEAVQDLVGHGTHCCGTAAGPLKPGASVPRYGIAYQSDLYVGKVLDNSGRGTDASILAGIDWAVQNQCAIVSMSLGAPTAVGERYSQVYETAARRAAGRGTLIIAAAGNESRRPQEIAPVGHPANCPSIVAVAALDRADVVAFFSSGALNPEGGEVNIAGPGVDVFSAWPQPLNYKTISGTSMATPHVAGIAALFAEATAQRGFALANTILRAARRLPPARDFGWGFVQSP
jgi:subtilisin family serine protease